MLLLTQLFKQLGRRRQWQFGLLLVLTLMSALSEVISLGAVLPFLGVLTAPDRVFNYPFVSKIAYFFGITSPDQLVLPLAAGFAVAAMLAGMFRVLLLWASNRFVYACGADLCIEAYRRTLYQPYMTHLLRNSSVVITGINKVSNAQGVLQALVGLIVSIVLMVSIMLVLLSIDAMVATISAVAFAVIYGVITWLSRKGLQRNSQCLALESTQMMKALQEGLGGIREVLLDGTQPLYCDVYRKSQLPVARAQANNTFITTSPRYVMEAFGMVLIAALAYAFSHTTVGVGITAALPVLGALALGAQRMLPALQQCYGSWASILSNQASAADVLKLLEQSLPSEACQVAVMPLVFRQAIRFDVVRFRYSRESPWVLDGLNFTIPKGIRVGFVGVTGSGKSTMLDLLMGLLEVTDGQILVDGMPIHGERRRAWQRTLAHVPQAIYLADTTLLENIAFGVPRERIDSFQVCQAARQAQIADFIESCPEGYETLVGERGVRLSGGQRQRIGIARALYKQASVLVFDEATSALDTATEQAVMTTIGMLQSHLTILLVAHRLTTVQHCDLIIEIGDGRVVAQGTYKDLLEHSASFRTMAKVAEHKKLEARILS